MILLEIDPVAQVFGVDPTNVVAVLCGVLVLAVIYQTMQLRAKDKAIEQANKENMDLLRESLGTLNDLVSTNKIMSEVLNEVRTNTTASVTTLSNKLDNNRDKVIEQITHVKERLDRGV